MFTASVFAEPPSGANAFSTRLPNIVIMLADDMGFGEVQKFNPDRGKIPTPHLDSLANEGMIFTDAHSGSSVCTPTRYGLLTGRYAWRTRLQSGVLTGGESLIAKDRLTMAKLLKQAGYSTAVIGKWHLGMLFDGKKISGKVPVGAAVTHGPVDYGGFELFQGFHHARQIEVWIENDKVNESIEAIEMLPRLTQSAIDFIHKNASSDRPFFLYVPWSSPHSPVVPAAEWQGKSGLNEHADFVMQTDDSFGQVIAALKQEGLFENTLVICAADNGTSAPTSNLQQLEAMGHFPSGPLRGSKADIWDGGHRVPMIASWPAVIQAGGRCGEAICLNDIFATVAEIVDATLPSDAAEDSFSLLPLLQGNGGFQRAPVVHHSIGGYFAIRDGDWKLSLCPRSGGWTGERPSKKSWKAAVEQGLPLVQLYNVKEDLGERDNLAASMPGKVAELRSKLEQLIGSGRSTPGPDQPNDVKVKIDKIILE